jgi:hypothetical protein
MCTINRGVAQPGSALAWGASGRVFKSHRPDYTILFLEIIFVSNISCQIKNQVTNAQV